MSQHEFTAGFLFCGLGAGARGFVEAASRLGKDEAKFRNLGGIDNDPLSCADFEYLTGGPALCADLSKMTPWQLRKAWGKDSPDAVFLSPPCKGFSGLLSKKSAQQEKYQALNRLVLQGMFLVCETWKRPPALLVLENVPRITTRGAELLRQVRQLLGGYGYLFHEATHDCGEIGELAQHRRRFLMVARLPSACGAYVYRPPKKRVRACGEVLGDLPMPEHPAAGDLHRLPKLSWLNWLRLARIPPGGDWRDLDRPLPGTPEFEALRTNTRPGRFTNQYRVRDWKKPAGAVTGDTDVQEGAQLVADPRLGLQRTAFNDIDRVEGWDQPAAAVTTNVRRAVADPRLALGATGENAKDFKGRPGLMGVGDWERPAPTVTGTMQVSGGHGTAAVADPRVTRRNGSLGVKDWSGPADTVTGESYPSNGSASAADPRTSSFLDEKGEVSLSIGNSDRSRGGALGVLDWEKPAKTVTGEMRPGGSNTPAAVADPRLGLDHGSYTDSYGVTGWNEPASTVRGLSEVRTSKSAVADPRGLLLDRAKPFGSPAPSSGGGAVADPRLGLDAENPDRHWNKYSVEAWEDPARSVIGATRPGSGGPAVADPREIKVGTTPRSGSYGVMSWEAAAATVTGSAHGWDCGPSSVADPREVALKCRPRGKSKGPYGVISWNEAAATVTGSACHDNGAFSVADPRKPPTFVPVILSPWDGTWHRPLTTLELAALQGLPPRLDGKPLQLAGRSIAKWRERIGNAVPVQAARAIAETLLVALLAAKLGTWTLGSTGIWVRKDGLTEDQANAPYEIDVREVA